MFHFFKDNNEITNDKCSSSPCWHGGTCIEEGNGFKCECKPEYHGKTCLVERIDPCKNHDCPNVSTCIKHSANHYSCLCPLGYENPLCWFNSSGETLASSVINECSSSPCQNQGICIDQNNDYKCECLPAYTGKNCEFQNPDPLSLIHI